MAASSLTDWMLDTDPALAWQVQRDLLGAPESEWQATRARVATEGMGARMLEHQDADGRGASPASGGGTTTEPAAQGGEGGESEARARGGGLGGVVPREGGDWRGGGEPYCRWTDPQPPPAPLTNGSSGE